MASAYSVLVAATDVFTDGLSALSFEAPVAFAYNPLQYAREPYLAYLRLAQKQINVLFVGMNPGPFGMMQTGVPFGEVETVRDWLQIEGAVTAPSEVHPKRPVVGFACQRREVSGQRVWGLVEAVFKTPRAFFEKCFILNYCPFIFFDGNGRNITPDKLKQGNREALFQKCDEHLAAVQRILQPSFVVGIGKFAFERAKTVLTGSNLQIGQILHPSPANPFANRDWAGTVCRQLRDFGIEMHRS